MPVKVDLFAGDRFVVVEIMGHVTRRELVWATESARDLARTHEVNGILADARGMEVDLTPAFASEIIENFLLALDKPLPVAGVRPAGWSDLHQEAAQKTLDTLATQTLSFPDREAALAWLRGQVEDRLEDL